MNLNLPKKMSELEQYTLNQFKNNHVLPDHFIYERDYNLYADVIRFHYTPDWLKGSKGKNLELDFYIPSIQTAIEVQGRQHREFCEWFHKTYAEFEDQVRRDKEKQEICNKLGIKLFAVESKQEIETVIKKIRTEMWDSTIGPTYHQTLDQIADGMTRLYIEAEKIRNQMAKLEESGIIDAGIHWRKDRSGDKTILELVYSTHSDRVKVEGKRRIEYIGKRPEKIEAAQAALARFDEYQKLKSVLNRIEGQISRNEKTLQLLKNYLDLDICDTLYH